MRKKLLIISIILTILVVVIVFTTIPQYQNQPKNNHTSKPTSNKEKPLKKLIYKIRKGDSVISIAQKFNILPWQLRVANNMSAKATLIHPGDTLRIPHIKWNAYHGKASWYGPNFHGKKMANGAIYDQEKILIAHRTLPLGIRVRITNTNTGESIIAQVLDRGPYAKNTDGKYSREVDLSYGAAKKLSAVKPGVIPVKIEPLG